ncbi:hypothetical protein GN956_G14234 [Arapaima gigas]
MAAVTAVQRFLRRWDRGGHAARSRMLATFVRENAGATGAELEVRFAHMASLLLARISAWMRLHYTCQKCLGPQLRAAAVFLSAPSNHCYLRDFLEVGGIFTLLDVIRGQQSSEENKAEALRLLQVVSGAGRTFKELVCESSGLPAIGECLLDSAAEETRGAAAVLLDSLVRGNPKYRKAVYMELIALLSRSPPVAQQLLLPTLSAVQRSLSSAHPSILEAVFNLLKSLSPEVQHEALELIRALKEYEVMPALLEGLVALLKPAEERIPRSGVLEGISTGPPSATVSDGEFPAFVQQAAAARAIRMLSQESQEVSEELLRHRVVHHLLAAMGTRRRAEVQQQASLALEQFVRANPVVEEHVREAMGSALFDLFTENAEVLHLKMDEIQVDKLLSNNVNVSEGTYFVRDTSARSEPFKTHRFETRRWPSFTRKIFSCFQLSRSLQTDS